MSLEGAAISLGAAIISVFFSATVLRNFLERRKPYNLMWGVGLVMFALVAFIQVAAEFGTWTDPLFRAWYVMGTSLVAFLGAGSVYIAHRKLGHAFAAYVAILLLAFLAVALTAATNSDAISTFGTAGPNGIVSPSGDGWATRTPRLFSPLFTIPGTLTLVGIALYGLVRYRLTYNAYIAGGAIVLAVGTGLASLGVPSLIYGAEFAGIAVMFVGFLKAAEWAKEHRRTSPRGALPAAASEETKPSEAVDATPK